MPSRVYSSDAKLPSIELKTWFIEPVFARDRQLSLGMFRVWGKTRDTQRSARWWRSSSIRQRLSSTLLKTRYGTLVSLNGGICKRNARKLRMAADAIERFDKGFPATWKRTLTQSFNADILKESNTHIQPRRSLRNRDKKNSEEPVNRESPIKRPEPRTEVRRQALVTSPMQERKKKRSHRTQGVDSGPAVEEPVRKPTKTMPVTKTIEPRDKHPLAGKLKNAQDAKKARRARRVAFAAVPANAANAQSSHISRTPRPERISAPSVQPLEKMAVPEWSASQRMAFERQRNSIAADTADYWETVARGVKGKNALECRALWESSWSSPRAREIPRGRVKELTGEKIVADLQKAVRSKRSRNTAKFRNQTRKLVELVAEGTLDTVLEPLVPGAAAVQNVAVTPRLQGIGALSQGTPGTEVRRKREQNEREGTIATPEILSRGRKVGFAEADHYVSLFKRRAGKNVEKGDVKGSEMLGVENHSGRQVDKNVERRFWDEYAVRRVQNNDSEASDYSDESSPFF